MNRLLLLVAGLMVSYNVFSQFPTQRERDSLNRLSAEDHREMMLLLHIDSLRQGANGNDMNAPNAVNYEEAKANPFPELPNPLVFKNGKTVSTPADWMKRKLEIREDFEREIYGRIPNKFPAVDWIIVKQRDTMIGEHAALMQKLIGHVDNSSFPEISVDMDLTLVLPANASDRMPVVIEFYWGLWRRPGDTSVPQPSAWQIDCIRRGWAYALLRPNSIQADNGAGLTQGIIGLVNKGQRRKPDDSGALRAWAWGASQTLDYFTGRSDLDETRVSIGGHSRYGKAALVTMAFDERFSAAYISSSGEGGAKLNRRNYGEIVENLTGSGEYHWMAGNFIKYGGPLCWDDLPVDAHELIALCAPRPVFVGCGSNGDQWTDQRGMFMATAAAGPVYRLLGKKDLGTDEMPEINHGLLEGDLVWRQHDEGHTPAPNYPYFLDFCARYWQH